MSEEKEQPRRLSNGTTVYHDDEPRYESGVHRIPMPEDLELDTFIEIVSVGCTDANTDRPPLYKVAVRNDYMDNANVGAGMWGYVVGDVFKQAVAMMVDQYNRPYEDVWQEVLTAMMDSIGAQEVTIEDMEKMVGENDSQPEHPKHGRIDT